VEIVLRGEPQGFLVPLDPHVNAHLGRDQKTSASPESGVHQGQLSFTAREETP
jgi:hypothetical protein